MKQFFSVRRVLPLALAFVFLFLTACSSGTLEGETKTMDAPKTEVAQKPAKTYSVQTPFTMAELDAIPVATADMTEDQLRQICLDFARLQGTIPWIASDDIKYALETSTSDANGYMNFKKGQVYAGLPYTAAGSNLYTFLDYYDLETGVLSESVYKNVGDLLGNNCCTALFWAWSRVSSSITFTHTKGQVPSTGIIPLGNYTFDQTIPSYQNCTTKSICLANGEQTMYESYALLKLADGVVMNNQGDPNLTGNHTMMVSILPNIVRNADGTINGDESYLNVVEQHEVLRSYTLPDGSAALVEAGIDTKFSFAKLYSMGYIPFQIPEIIGAAPVQKAQATIPHENGETVTLSQLQEEAITSNYALSKLTITVTDASGEVTEKTSYSGVARYTWDLKSPMVTLDRQLKSGEYAMKIQVLVGSGETLTVFEGTLKV